MFANSKLLDETLSYEGTSEKSENSENLHLKIGANTGHSQFAQFKTEVLKLLYCSLSLFTVNKPVLEFSCYTLICKYAYHLKKEQLIELLSNSK